MAKEINIKSSTIERGLEIATKFLDVVIIPCISEVGLLVKDKVSLWRFNNQIKMLIRAKEICDKNNINPKEISLKILWTLLSGKDKIFLSLSSVKTSPLSAKFLMSNEYGSKCLEMAKLIEETNIKGTIKL